jgi:hypothetical protein
VALDEDFERRCLTTADEALQQLAIGPIRTLAQKRRSPKVPDDPVHRTRRHVPSSEADNAYSLFTITRTKAY